MSEDAFQIRDVSFRYRLGKTPALRGASLCQQRGSLIAVMGKTGAGKSTLAMCLNGTVPRFFRGELSGEVVVMGRAASDASVGQLAADVGVVFQDFECLLFSTDVAHEMAFAPENLGVPPAEILERCRRYLSLVGLSGFEARDPHALSGGQKQRLAIASVLAMEPKLLVLDEPTTDIDPAGKVEIMRIVEQLVAEGMAVLVILDESELAQCADRVAIMSQGEVVVDGPAERVLADVAQLHSHGIRPPQLNELMAKLGREPRVRSVDEAESEIRASGLAFSPEAYERVKAGDRPASPDAPADVEVRGLSHSYSANSESLSDVDLRIGRGEFLALVGQNGSGKTTLVKHIVGLLKPLPGRVFVDGADIAGRAVSQLSETVGLVFQNPDHQIFSDTVADEVAFGPRNRGMSEEQIAAASAHVLEVVGLAGREGADPFALTKGERQRLAVASTLAMDPQILILDEPTTGLDYDDQRHMMGLLRELNAQGRTIVIVTHSMWVVAEYAHRAVVMAGGKVVADGPVREVFAQTRRLVGASLVPPEITQLGLRLGGATLSVDELVACLGAASEA